MPRCFRIARPTESCRSPHPVLCKAGQAQTSSLITATLVVIMEKIPLNYEASEGDTNKQTTSTLPSEVVQCLEDARFVRAYPALITTTELTLAASSRHLYRQCPARLAHELHIPPFVPILHSPGDCHDHKPGVPKDD